MLIMPMNIIITVAFAQSSHGLSYNPVFGPSCIRTRIQSSQVLQHAISCVSRSVSNSDIPQVMQLYYFFHHKWQVASENDN